MPPSAKKEKKVTTNIHRLTSPELRTERFSGHLREEKG